MAIKQVLQPDVMLGSSYKLIVDGVEFIATEVSEAEQTNEPIELPDKTKVPSGRTSPGTFEVMIPQHHDVEYAFFETWWTLGQSPVSPAAFKTAIIQSLSNSEAKVRNEERTGCWIEARSGPAHGMETDEMNVVKYTISFNENVST